jgi:hypothetical protein
MSVRHVVTGHQENGDATFVSDTQVEAITTALVPGYELYRLWALDAPPVVPATGSSAPNGTYFPGLGGARFGLFTVPPDLVVELCEQAQNGSLHEAR